MHEPDLAPADLLVRARSRPAADGGVSLATARVVVGGGRGVGGPDGFAPLEELASLLGGVVGVSRVVTSEGWRPHTQQVGQTGTKITPELYLACGISGAIQHMAGLRQRQAHRGDQHRSRGADPVPGRLRGHRRPGRGHPGPDRRDQGTGVRAGPPESPAGPASGRSVRGTGRVWVRSVGGVQIFPDGLGQRVIRAERLLAVGQGALEHRDRLGQPQRGVIGGGQVGP